MDGDCYYNDGNVYIVKKNGIHCYDMATLKHTITDKLPFSINGIKSRSKEHFVPVLCTQCYGTTQTEYNNYADLADKPGKYIIGLACTYDRFDSDFNPSSYPNSKKGDIDSTKMNNYFMSLENVKYMCHVMPGEVLYRHKAPFLGNVLFYWHVHTPNTCGVNALVRCRSDDDLDGATELAFSTGSAFSWTTTSTGERDIVVELSLVFMPARPGCFAYCFSEGVRKNLEIMNFAAQTSLLCGEYPINPFVDFLKATPDKKLDVDITTMNVQMLTEYVRALNDKIELLNVLYKNKGDCVAERHIQVGKDKFKYINGEEAANHIVKSNILTAETEAVTDKEDMTTQNNNSQSTITPIPGPAPSVYQIPYNVPLYMSAPPQGYPMVHAQGTSTIADQSIFDAVLHKLENQRENERKRKQTDEMCESVARMEKQMCRLEDVEHMLKDIVQAQADMKEYTAKQYASANVLANATPGVFTPADMDKIVKMLLDGLTQNMSQNLLTKADFIDALSAAVKPPTQADNTDQRVKQQKKPELKKIENPKNINNEIVNVLIDSIQNE